MNDSSRRHFLKNLTGSAAALTVGSSLFGADTPSHFIQQIRDRRPFSANDNVNFALIGAGGMGTQDTITALSTPGVKLVAVCDLYDGRLKDAKTKWGADIFTTKVYKEVLNRKDIDAVIIAVPDFWHQQISIDAMRAGKHVYCEKPMVHAIAEGPAVIAAQKETGKVFQVRASNINKRLVRKRRLIVS